MKGLKIFFLIVLLFFFLIGVGFVAINVYVLNYAKPYIYSDLNELPKKFTVIVPGARVYKTTVSHVVRDRLEAASSCIKKGKVERVLISGDHGRKDYDEVNRMRLFMQEVYNIDCSYIFMDHAGFSTYDTMYRARDIFCVKDAIVVTQKFHTARSVYIARKLGLDVVAYVAPEITPFPSRFHRSWEFRESLARVKNFFLVAFNAKPKFLGNQIPITGDARESWD